MLARRNTVKLVQCHLLTIAEAIAVVLVQKSFAYPRKQTMSAIIVAPASCEDRGVMFFFFACKRIKDFTCKSCA